MTDANLQQCLKFEATMPYSPLVVALAASLPFVNEPPAGVSPMTWHSLAGVAKYACMNHFIARQPMMPYANNIFTAYFTDLKPPHLKNIKDDQSDLKPQFEIDAARASITVSYQGLSRTARYWGDPGCIVVPNDTALRFTPERITSALPPAAQVIWPLGDRNATALQSAFSQAADTAFDDAAANTAAVVIIHNGKIVAERYAVNSDSETLFHGWSMTKSIQMTMLGALEQQGRIRLYEPTGFAEWQNDSRKEIRLGDLLRMSSGLKCLNPLDYTLAAYDDVGYPHYQLSWTDAIDAAGYITTLPAWFPPGTYGKYKDCDPAAAAKMLRTKIELTGSNYHQWPQTAIFDKLGIRSMRIGTDAAGNMLAAADGFATARDWARLGLLWLNGGASPTGERLLSLAVQTFALMPTPNWINRDGAGYYGAGFWLQEHSDINPSGDDFSMRGGSGQRVMIIPSLKLVVVHLTHDDLMNQPGKASRQLLKLSVAAAQTGR
jgi:CubicO group peptidase (beta-lactamase class C family)